MKRIISLILAATMLLGAASMLGSCKYVKRGSEAAKLLLANERLDEGIVGGGVNVGLDYASPTASVSDSVIALTALSESRMNMTLDSTTSKAYSWEAGELQPYNGTVAQYASFVINMEHQAARTAEDIAVMKERVGIVDKWVKVGVEKQLLRVEESRDILITLNELGDIHVCYRYTNDQAINVYEMYSLTIYEGGETGIIRSLYIPGLRFEYGYINSNGFEDFVIMDNSRGYWICTRYSYHVYEDVGRHSVYAEALVNKDGIASAVSLSAEGAAFENAELKTVGISVGNLATGNEVVGVSRYTGDLSHALSVGLGAIKSGLVSVGADEAFEVAGKMQTGRLNYIETLKGAINAEDDSTDPISFVSGMIDYRTGPTIEGYQGEIEFRGRDFENTDAAVSALYDYLDAAGLVLELGEERVKESLAFAEDFGAAFGDTFVWNGYNLKTINDVIGARESFIKQGEDARAAYEAVKNNPEAEGRQRLSYFASFDELSDIVMGSNTYHDGRVTLEGVGAVIARPSLLEEGDSYVLKVALALTDGNGKPVAVNTVPLKGGDGSSFVYSGGRLSLVAKGEFTVPKNLDAGRYALVIYAATADEGIRVTEMVKIAGFAAEDEELPSEAMRIGVRTEDGNLLVSYEIKNSYTITVKVKEGGYSAEELTRIIRVEILKHGAPYSGAKLEYKNGGAAVGSLGRGEYRMMCYLNTADGLAQSYVYLIVE